MQELKAERRALEVDLKAAAADLKRHDQAAKSASAKAASTGNTSKAASNESDDLKALAGIGPALEKKLRRRGFKTYRQLAELDAREIDALAEKLGLTAQKIRKDWLPKARKLARSGKR